MAKIPDGYSVFNTYLLYEDCEGALDWLGRVFGFKETFRMPGEDGRVGHAEMAYEGSTVMMGRPGADYRSPKSSGGAVHQDNYVYVPDVDAVYKRVVAEGVETLSEPEDMFYGDRTFRVADLEGHNWTFSTHVRDFDPETDQPPA